MPLKVNPKPRVISLQCLEDEPRYEQEAREKDALRESKRYARRRFRETTGHVAGDVTRLLGDANEALGLNPDDSALQELVAALQAYQSAAAEADELANEPPDDDVDDDDVDAMSESAVRLALKEHRARR